MSNYTNDYVLTTARSLMSNPIAISNNIQWSDSEDSTESSFYSGDVYAISNKEPYSGKLDERRNINVGLYFRYVKRKFTKLQQKELESRLKKLAAIRASAILGDQQALLEAVESKLLVAAREQILIVKGMEKYVWSSSVERFMNRVANVRHDNLKKFPRPIPANILKKIKSARELRVFDYFSVLYTDYTEEKPLKTAAEKIREKDPIVFGRMNCEPDKLYYVADWIDEYCDLTLDKLQKEFKVTSSIVHTELPDLMDPDILGDLAARVNRRLELLSTTKVSNWRDNEREAIEDERKSKLKKKSWLKRLFDKWAE